MNFIEVVELHRTIQAFCQKNLPKPPKLGIYDFQNKDQGYILCIKTAETAAYDGFLDFLKTVAETRKLELHKYKDFLVLQSFGSWSLR